MSVTDMLPESVREKVMFSPIEDILLHILRAQLPGLTILSLVPLDLQTAPFPFVLVRKGYSLGEWQGHPEFIDKANFEVQVFTRDPDGDEAGALVSEAIRVALHRAWREHVHVPGRGTVLQITMENEPHRVTDWATASGPVQYADLPSGVWRYEASYAISIRKPRR